MMEKTIRVLAAVLMLLVLPSVAQAYPIFYEANAPVQRGTGQTLMAGCVDAATGAFIKKFACVGIPGPAPMRGDIYYNTQDKSVGPFGPGTSCSYDFYIRATSLYPGATYELIAPGNLHYAFDTLSGSNYLDTHDPEMLGSALSFTSQPAGVTSTLTWKGGIRFQFDQYGGLIHIIDVPGNTIDIFHNGVSGFVSLVRWPTNTNRQIQFREDPYNTHVTQVAAYYSYLGSSRIWKIAYDTYTYGKMISLTDPMNFVYRFTWASYSRSDGALLPLLATVSDGRGMTCLSNHYDSFGRISSMDNALGGAQTLSYSAAIGSDGSTTGVNVNGHSSTSTYSWHPNHYGYMITQTRDNTLNETTTIAHTATPTYLPTSVTDFRGRVVSSTYNTSSGDILTEVSATAGGGTATTTYTYDSTFHKATSMTDPAGRVCHWNINPTTSNTDTFTDAAGAVTSYSYNSAGQPVTITDALGNVSSYTYDSYGMPTRVVEPNGSSGSMTLNDMGKMQYVTDELGNQTFYGYDANGNNTSISVYPSPGSPANTVLNNNYTYDAEGNCLTATDPAGHAWSWTYDCANHPLTETNPLGQRRSWTWTPMGELSTYTDFVGNNTVASFLSDGRLSLITVKNPTGTTDSTVTYNYDPTTHLFSSMVDTLTGTYSVTRDAIDRVTNATDPNGSVAYAFDVLGRVTSMTPTGQNPVTYTYHTRGNLATITQDAATTTLTADALGQATSATLPNGVVTTISRDANSRITMIASSKSGVVFDKTNYTYDAVGRPTQVVATSGSSHTITYTSYNQVASVTDQNNSANTYTYTYNPVGTRATQTVGGVTTTYGYDSANQLTTVGSLPVYYNANGSITGFNNYVYTWNSRNQLITYNGSGLTANYTYNPTGFPSSSVVNGTTTTNLYGTTGLVRQVVGGTPVNYLPGIKSGANFVSVNGNNSTTALTNGSGVVVGNYGYTPYGTPTHTGSATTPLQFLGGLSDTPSLVVGKAPYSTAFMQSLSHVGLSPRGPGPPGAGPSAGTVQVASADLPEEPQYTRPPPENQWGLPDDEHPCGAIGGGAGIRGGGMPDLFESTPLTKAGDTPAGIRGSVSIGLSNSSPFIKALCAKFGKLSLGEFGRLTGGATDRGAAGFEPRSQFKGIELTGDPNVYLPKVLTRATWVNVNWDWVKPAWTVAKLWLFEPGANGNFTNKEITLCHMEEFETEIRHYHCATLLPQSPLLDFKGYMDSQWADMLAELRASGGGKVGQVVMGNTGPGPYSGPVPK